MSTLPLERWARESIDREEICDWSPVESRSLLYDLDAFRRLGRLKWEERQRRMEATHRLCLTSERARRGLLPPRAIRLAGASVVFMPEGTYAGLLAYPNVQTITTTSINGVANLYPNLTYAPITANAILAPQAYRVAVCSKITTSTSPGNITMTPQVNSAGAWTTGGTAISGGTSLGATAAVALTASITNAFYIVLGDLTIRAGGTTSSIVSMLHFISTQGTTGGLAGPAAVGTGFNLMFGGTAATPDLQTAGSSFQLGATHTVLTITHNIEQLHFMDWN